MAEELISKKDILAQTGISYGQFYRWKRKGLIPEGRFIRRSTFTGQETFLPQDKILDRLERIKQLKDDYSLDEIVEFLSPEMVEGGYSREDLLRLKWISEDVFDHYNGLREGHGRYSFIELLYLAALERFRQQYLSQEEIKLALATLRGNENVLLEGERALIVARKQPHFFSLICTGHCAFDPQTEVVLRLYLDQLLEEVKIKVIK